MLFVKHILVCSSEAFLPVSAYQQGKATTVVTKRAGTSSTDCSTRECLLFMMVHKLERTSFDSQILSWF